MEPQTLVRMIKMKMKMKMSLHGMDCKVLLKVRVRRCS